MNEIGVKKFISTEKYTKRQNKIKVKNMNVEELKSQLDTNGLEKYFDKLQPLLRNTIRLYQKETDENEIATGQSKIGGKPDLPKGIAWVTETNTVEIKEKMLEPNAKNWKLLLQIDSNEENEMMWGDCGRLYFWIKKDDLQNRNFDKSWLSVQSF